MPSWEAPSPPGQLASDKLGELNRLGGGGPPKAAECTVWQRFLDHSRAHPEHEAVVCGKRSVAYGELAARSLALASRLRSLSTSPESVVGVCLPRRPDAVVAFLATLLAGGVYLPLDPTHPAERRRFMLEDSGASILITNEVLAAELQPTSAAVLADLPNADEAVHGELSGHTPASSDLAYILYTSGSTGRPKGVMIEHSSLATFVSWTAAAFARRELRSVLASTSFGFDISLFELLAPLSAGGRIVLVGNLLDLADPLDHEVTLVNTVPSLMSAALNRFDLPPTVETVCLAGEPLSAALVERVERQSCVKRVINAYGPTEDTIYSTTAEVTSDLRPTIGRPLPGTVALVLDEHRRLVPRGAPGELYLGGAGLARGYRGREDLTNERFVEQLDRHGKPRRLYRTGDLVQWTEDGDLQYLGRIDDQVKIRGVRIEPREIEAALRQHPAIRDAAVALRKARAGDQLAAYLLSDSTSVGSAELKTFLRRTLPEPMIPMSFTRVDQMPLNVNGKLDRRRLLALDAGANDTSVPRGAGADVPELTKTERELAMIWTEVLELDRTPSSDDDFFALGGDSLLALVLSAAISDEMACDMPPTVLLEASTLSQFAARIDAGLDRDPRIVSLHEGGVRAPCVYIHAGAGGLLTLRSFAPAVGPDQPFIGLQAYVEIADVREVPSITDTATECFAMLRRVQPTGPYLLVGHSIGGFVAYEVAQRLLRSGDQVPFLGLLDSCAPETLRWPGRIRASVRELLGLTDEARSWRELTLTAHKRWRARAESKSPEAGEVFGFGNQAWPLALLAAERAYRPLPYEGGATVFYTTKSARYAGSRTLGWERHIAGALEPVRIPGDHITMLQAPNVQAVAQAVAARVKAVQASMSRGPATRAEPEDSRFPLSV